MKKLSVKKLALAGMLCALCVVGSVFSFPMFGSKCAPIQDRKSTRLNSSHDQRSRMPSSA